MNEIEIFVGISCEVLLGIKVSHLHYCPCEDVCGSMAELLKCVRRSLEPLHNPCFVARFLMNDDIQHEMNDSIFQVCIIMNFPIYI